MAFFFKLMHIADGPRRDEDRVSGVGACVVCKTCADYIYPVRGTTGRLFSGSMAMNSRSSPSIHSDYKFIQMIWPL